ncbi:MAG: hypothetical protein ACR2FV_08840 [Ornithinimicrobium sp.]|jgi:hypothetical protein|uniref:hypothetical protein n=1 Tax=Ornithinimicrobium sp. TaxID=1977084 RepID=UPI003D9B2D9A
MEITDAQRDVREVYRGGAVGTAVSGVVWLLAVVVGQWVGIGLALAVWPWALAAAPWADGGGPV